MCLTAILTCSRITLDIARRTPAFPSQWVSSAPILRLVVPVKVQVLKREVKYALQ